MLLKQLVYTIVYYIPMALRYASFGGSPSASFKRPLALCFLSEAWNTATLVSTSALIFLAAAFASILYTRNRGLSGSAFDPEWQTQPQATRWLRPRLNRSFNMVLRAN